jgi:hypothetical protein
VKRALIPAELEREILYAGRRGVSWRRRLTVVPATGAGESRAKGERRMNTSERQSESSPAYEPPRVERVLTPAELEQEILYAGTTSPEQS